MKLVLAAIPTLLAVFAADCASVPVPPTEQPVERVRAASPDVAAPALDAAQSDIGSTAAPSNYLPAPVQEVPACVEEVKVPRRPELKNNIHPAFDKASETTHAVLGKRAQTRLSELPERVVLFENDRFANGAVRARFKMKRKLYAMVLLRARKDKRGRVSGIGLKIAHGEAQLIEVKADKEHPLGPKQPVYKFERLQDITVVVTALGSDLIAQIHESGDGIEYLSLHAPNAGGKKGGQALVVPPARNPDANELLLLSSRAACRITEAPLGERDPLPRYAKAKRAVIDKLPKSDRALFTERQDDGEGEATFETTVFGLERLACSRVRFDDVAIETPFKFIAEDYTLYRDKPPVKAAKGFRVDLSYKNIAMLEALMRAYAAEFPKQTKLVELGRSRAGYPILALALADDINDIDGRPSVLLNGAHHGNEPFSTHVVLDALQYLVARSGSDREVDEWLSKLVVWFVPMVNPEGIEEFLEVSRFVGRKNKWDVDGDGVAMRREGVDLNRNYPFQWGTTGRAAVKTSPFGRWHRGPSAASEPETKAVIGLADRERFASAISYHTGTVCVLAPYTINKQPNPEPNEAWTIGELLSKQMGEQIDGREFTLRRNLYPVEGVDQDWHRHEHGTVALLVEAVRSSPTDYCTRQAAMVPNRRSWQILLRRTVQGPTAVGRVIDGAGKPVEATITIAEQQLRNGENWTSRPRDGHFTRYLGAPGTYTFTATKAGRAVTKQVEVGLGMTRLELQLPAAAD